MKQNEGTTFVEIKIKHFQTTSEVMWIRAKVKVMREIYSDNCVNELKQYFFNHKQTCNLNMLKYG